MKSSLPPILLLIVPAVGICLALWRPFVGYLFGVFLFFAVDQKAFLHTRTEELGRYLNLSDTCVLVCFFAAVCYLFSSKKGRLRIPASAILVSAVLVLGLMIGYYNLGFSILLGRLFKYGMFFPISLVLSASVVDDEKKAVWLFRVLLVAALMEAIQQIMYADAQRQEAADMDVLVTHARTIQFGIELQAAVLIFSLLFAPLEMSFQSIALWLGIVLCSASVALLQTRSTYIASVASVLLMGFLFRKKIPVPTMVIKGTILAFGAVLLLILTRGWIDFGMVIVNRLRTFQYAPTESASLMTGRLNALYASLYAWATGGMVFGNGLVFPFEQITAELGFTQCAWQHLAYPTYLAHFGIVGFLVYGVRVPLSIFRDSRRVYRSAKTDEVCKAGAFALIVVVYMHLQFVMSASLLQAYEGMLLGSVGGAMWALSRRLAAEQREARIPSRSLAEA